MRDASAARSAACCGRHVLGHRRRGHVEARQLLDQERRRRWARAARARGRAWAACGRPGSPPPARWPGSSAARSGGATRSAPRGARRSRGRRRRTRTRARGRRARASRGASASARDTSRAASSGAAQGSSARALPGEDRVHLAVGEAPVAAHARAVEAHVADLGAVQLHLHRHGQPLLAGAQRAGAVGERLGQHRLDRAGHVHARGRGAGPRARAGRRGAGRRSRRRCGPRRGRARPRGGPRWRRRSPARRRGRS